MSAKRKIHYIYYSAMTLPQKKILPQLKLLIVSFANTGYNLK